MGLQPYFSASSFAIKDPSFLTRWLLVFVDDSGLGFAGGDVDKAGEQRNLVGLVEVFPNFLGEGIDVAADLHRGRLSLIGRDRVAVALIGVDKVALARLGVAFITAIFWECMIFMRD